MEVETHASPALADTQLMAQRDVLVSLQQAGSLFSARVAGIRWALPCTKYTHPRQVCFGNAWLEPVVAQLPKLSTATDQQCALSCLLLLLLSRLLLASVVAVAAAATAGPGASTPQPTHW